MTEIPKLDLNDPMHLHINKGPLPSTAGIEVFEELPAGEMRKKFYDMFQQIEKDKAGLVDKYAPWHFGYDDDYHPYHINYNDRGATGFENQPLAKQTFLEFERLIEHVFNYHRKKDQAMQMYKGVTKKWQILDDSFDREEIRKIQKAAKAPSPEELEVWMTKNKPMKLPISNDNVHDWRDERSAIESADFNPKLVEVDRERNQQFYLKRYEKPKEIADH